MTSAAMRSVFRAARGPRRISDHCRAQRNDACDDGACTDRRRLTDPHVPEDHSAGTDRSAPFDRGALQRPVPVGLELPGRGDGAWMLVVDEDDAMTDEDLVVNLHTRADERVTLDLAAFTDRDIALNLDVRTDAA